MKERYYKMEIKIKEIVTLTPEEKKAIREVHILRMDILEQVNDPEIFDATKSVCDKLEEFEYLVDTELE
jgi:hypothetical protein